MKIEKFFSCVFARIKVNFNSNVLFNEIVFDVIRKLFNLITAVKAQF